MITSTHPILDEHAGWTALLAEQQEFIDTRAKAVQRLNAHALQAETARQQYAGKVREAALAGKDLPQPPPVVPDELHAAAFALNEESNRFVLQHRTAERDAWLQEHLPELWAAYSARVDELRTEVNRLVRSQGKNRDLIPVAEEYRQLLALWAVLAHVQTGRHQNVPTLSTGEVVDRLLAEDWTPVPAPAAVQSGDAAEGPDAGRFDSFEVPADGGTTLMFGSTNREEISA